MKPIPKKDIIQKYLTYDAHTGILFHKNGSPAGGFHKDGYITVGFNKKKYLAHRVIWTLLNGAIPDGSQIDHINHNRSDNRIQNLRIVTAAENAKNKSISVVNRSGFLGVYWVARLSKWKAVIEINNKKQYLGIYSCITDAVRARRKAEANLLFHKNHGVCV
jgi:hypothetical protein